MDMTSVPAAADELAEKTENTNPPATTVIPKRTTVARIGLIALRLFKSVFCLLFCIIAILRQNFGYKANFDSMI
jgi:hypothetical protein